MIKRRRFPKIFPGWWTVMAGGLTSGWAHSYQMYGFSALFKPIASELGFSRAVASIPTSIGRFEGGFEAPLTGWITDRFGPRWITLIGLFLVGLGLILMNFINSLWAFIVVWGVIVGTGSNIGVVTPTVTSITNWFVKKRGLAQAIRTVIFNLVAMVVVPLIGWLIITQGWRMTCVIGGVVMWLVGLPLVWFFYKRHRPEYYGLLPDGATAEEETTETDQMIDRGVKYAAEVQEVEFTLRQVMRTPTYWLLLVAEALGGLMLPIMNLHSIPFLTDRGIDPLVAAGMMSIFIATSIPGRLVGGFLADRVRKSHLRFLWAGGALLQAIGIAAFLLNQQSIAMIYIWFILYGIGNGVDRSVSMPMRGRYFGRKSYGSISGISSMLNTPVGMAIPVYAGWIYDTTGNYISVFTLLAVAMVLAAVVMSFILPPKPPAQITDIRKII